MIAVAPRLGSLSVGLALLRLAVRASSATSITIVFHRASDSLPPWPRGEAAAMPSSVRAAAAREKLLRVFILLFFLFFFGPEGVGTDVARTSRIEISSMNRLINRSLPV